MTRMDAWSRRKAAVEAENRAAEAAETARLREAEAATLEARDDQDILEEMGLPEPEDLETPEAVRKFMNEALPQRLKTRALRRLWRLNPILANVDGLVDYGEDFTDAAMVVENLQTAYQVGKGMLAHIEALAAQEAAEEDAAGASDLPEDMDEAPAPLAVVADIEAHEPPAPLAPTQRAETPEDIEDVVSVPVRRRMAFSFDTQDTEEVA